MRELDSTLFNWSTWRSGTLLDLLGIVNRTYHLVQNQHILRKHAVGFAPAERLLCRPKTNCMAVMFFVNGVHFWTHLRNHEFNTIWEAYEDGPSVCVGWGCR